MLGLVVSGGMLVWPLVQGYFSPMQAIGTLGVTQLLNARNVVVLDVRDAKEYAAGHLPRATNIPLPELKARAGELAKQSARPVVVYCENGTKSAGASAALEKQGFKEIRRLSGGIRAWREAGLPVEKSAPA